MIAFELLPYIEFVDDSGQTRRLRANVQESEEINLSSEVTEHPVESGSNISDHNRASPDEVSQELFFSDAITRTDILSPAPDVLAVEIKLPKKPLGLGDLLSTSNLLTAGIGAVSDLLNPKQKMIANYFGPPPRSRLAEAYDIIQELRRTGKLVTVKTTTAVFEDMAILTAVITRNSATGSGGRISLSYKKIRFVQSDITLALPLPKDARAQKKKSAGNQVPFGPPAPKTTALKKVSNAAGVTQPGSGT